MQTSYPVQSANGFPVGALADGDAVDVLTAVNSSPGAAQIDLMTITGYVALKVLNWTIDGVAFTYTMTVADANETGVAASITAQLNSEPLFSGRYHATSALGVITLTARFPGVGWTLVATGANAANNAITNSTVNAVAIALPFGRLVINDGQITGAPERKGKLATAANMTAKVVNLTPLAVNSVVYTVAVSVNGLIYNAETTSGGAATVKEIVEALVPILNALLPANTVLAAEDDTKITLTAEVAGQTFSVSAGSSNTGATWTVTDTALTTDDVNACILGVSVRDTTREVNSTTEPGYAANAACGILRKGRIVVNTESQITAGGPVWVRVATATTYPLGGFSGALSAGVKVKLDPNKFRWGKSISATQAVLEVLSV